MCSEAVLAKQNEEAIALSHALLERPRLERGSGEEEEGEGSKSCFQVGKLGFLGASVRKPNPNLLKPSRGICWLL